MFFGLRVSRTASIIGSPSGFNLAGKGGGGDSVHPRRGFTSQDVRRRGALAPRWRYAATAGARNKYSMAIGGASTELPAPPTAAAGAARRGVTCDRHIFPHSDT